MALAVWSLITMPLLGIAKQRIADQIGSAATKGEGRQNVLCAYLAGALLIGLAGNAIAGAWWLDPVVGLLIAAVAVKEGAEAWRGDGCCVGSPLDGYALDGRSLPRRLLPLSRLVEHPAHYCATIGGTVRRPEPGAPRYRLEPIAQRALSSRDGRDTDRTRWSQRGIPCDTAPGVGASLTRERGNSAGHRSVVIHLRGVGAACTGHRGNNAEWGCLGRTAVAVLVATRVGKSLPASGRRDASLDGPRH